MNSDYMSVSIGRLETFLSRNYATAVIAVVGIGLILRVLAAVLEADINPATAKVYEYGEIAAATVAHGSLTRQIPRPDGTIWVFPTAFMPPLGILIWLPVYKLLGVSRLALATIVSINVVCGAAIVYGCIRIARLLFGLATIAVLAGIFAAFNPVFIYSVATYHAVNLYLVELLLLFYACSSVFAATTRQAILIGVLFAVAILTRTEYLILGGALIFGALLRHRRPGLTAISLLVALLLVAPWTARNYLVFGRFIPVANTAGLNLAKGFNAQANGSGHWMDVHGIIDQQFKAETDAIPLSRHYESDVDAVYRAGAREFIAHHPVRSFIVLPARKILLFWFFDIYDDQTHSILYQLSIWPVILLSMVGIIFAFRSSLFRTPDHRSVVALFAAQTIVTVSYAVHARYRMNVDTFLFAYSAAGLVWVVCRGHLPESFAGGAGGGGGSHHFASPVQHAGADAEPQALIAMIKGSGQETAGQHS